MDPSNIAISVTRPGLGSTGTTVFENNTVTISPSTKDVWIRAEPEAINSDTNSGAFYRVEIELAETDVVESVWIILNNEYTPVADPGPQVSLVSYLSLPSMSRIMRNFVFSSPEP